jgi:predicted  nucleic acid-binding Zn-ribbon protein
MHYSVAAPSSPEDRQRWQRLDERVAQQQALIDRLLLADTDKRHQGAYEQQHSANTSPARYNRTGGALNFSAGSAAAAPGAADAPQPGAVRLEISLLQQRAAAMESRLLSVEGSVSRLVARIEDIGDRLLAESRSIESAVIIAQEARDTAAAAAVKTEVTATSIEERLEQTRERLFEVLDERVAARVEAALRQFARQQQSEADEATRRTADRFASVEAEMAKGTDHAVSLLTRGLGAVKRHVAQALDRHSVAAQSRLDTWEQARAAAARAEAELADDMAQMRRGIGELQAHVARLDDADKDFASRGVRWDEELRSLHRRLMSALRHLAAEPSGMSLSHLVSPVAAAAGDERFDISSRHAGGHETLLGDRSVQGNASRMGGAGSSGMSGFGGGPNSVSRSRGGNASAARAHNSSSRVSFNTTSADASGGAAAATSGAASLSAAAAPLLTGGPIDTFLAELSALVRTEATL